LTGLAWWGWGSQDVTCDLDSRPAFWPFLTTALGLSGEESGGVVPLESIPLRPSRLPG
jgi:hypothetical protein